MVLQWRVLVSYTSFTVIQNINDTYFVSKIGWNDDNKDTKGLNGACSRKDQWLIVRLPGKGDDIMDKRLATAVPCYLTFQNKSA
jgi:hypothetical protein